MDMYMDIDIDMDMDIDINIDVDICIYIYVYWYIDDRKESCKMSQGIKKMPVHHHHQEVRHFFNYK